MALTKVTKELIQGSLSVEWQSAIKTSSFQSITGQGYFVNTTASAVTVTMPATASVGDIVSIVDYAGTAQTNNITITAALNINGSANDVKINYERGAVSIVYSGTIQGWVAEFAANEGTSAFVTPIPVDYLVVAGGGSGTYSCCSRASGGGGAGGLRTSYTLPTGNSGGGSSAESSKSVIPKTSYDIVVGNGGIAPTVAGNQGASGDNSEFDVIISQGGGKGGHQQGAAFAGGSGGGGSATLVGGAGTIDQGFAGGDGSGHASGGGGGAAALGVNAGSPNTFYGGNGGAGLAVNILNATEAASRSVGVVSGSDVYYSGGGGGGAYDTSRPRPSGGIGGGGAGAQGTYLGGANGTPRTGGGGGAGTPSTSPGLGGDGGSGLVILRYLTTSAPNGYSTTGITPVVIIDGTDTLLLFTTVGTGTITFS